MIRSVEARHCHRRAGLLFRDLRLDSLRGRGRRRQWGNCRSSVCWVRARQPRGEPEHAIERDRVMLGDVARRRSRLHLALLARQRHLRSVLLSDPTQLHRRLSGSTMEQERCRDTPHPAASNMEALLLQSKLPMGHSGRRTTNTASRIRALQRVTWRGGGSPMGATEAACYSASLIGEAQRGQFATRPAGTPIMSCSSA